MKNLFVFVGIFFSRRLFDAAGLFPAAMGFVLFSLAASAVYLFNDIHDLKKDRAHQTKRQRPLAAGLLSVPLAYGTLVALAVAALAGALALNGRFAAILVVYLLFNVVYSLRAKDVVIIDVMIIAAGFLLRVIAGTILARVEPSSWLVLSTIMISLFLGFTKRRNELVVNNGKPDHQRPVLAHYTIPFLDQMISIATAGTVITYALYTVADDTVDRFGSGHLVYTVPFVLYGIFRYLYLGYSRQQGEDPAHTVSSDWPLLVNCALWAASVFLIIYVRRW